MASTNLCIAGAVAFVLSYCSEASCWVFLGPSQGPFLAGPKACCEPFVVPEGASDTPKALWGQDALRVRGSRASPLPAGSLLGIYQGWVGSKHELLALMHWKGGLALCNFYPHATDILATTYTANIPVVNLHC